MSGEDINFNIHVNVMNAEQAWNTSRRLLYSLNAIRLSVVDIERVFRGPTIGNVLWTAIQIQRTFTHIRRLQDLVIAKQAVGVGVGAARGAQMLGGKTLGGTVGAFGTGGLMQTTFGAAGVATAPKSGLLLGKLLALLATPVGVTTVGALVAGATVAGMVVGGGYLLHRAQKREREEWINSQRETAKQQGLEPW